MILQTFTLELLHPNEKDEITKQDKRILCVSFNMFPVFPCDASATVREYLQRWQEAYVINIIVNKRLCTHQLEETVVPHYAESIRSGRLLF